VLVSLWLAFAGAKVKAFAAPVIGFPTARFVPPMPPLPVR
jgi:hypothetical protein